jgi:UDP-N-acetylglucosamine 2-epimerase
MKIVSIVGARPQFIKAAAVSDVIRREHTEILVHTGQHYDDEMSAIFFREMGIPEPDYHLGVGSGSHGWQTGQMLVQIEELLLDEQPDWVLVYGDTNSTLAGALAAVKLQIPVAHVEAGLRSYNRAMPEEHNRILTDHCAQLLFCPTETAVHNLRREGMEKGVFLVGDVMYDAARKFRRIAQQRSNILDSLALDPGTYLLATVHRAANTDSKERLQHILNMFGAVDETIVFPAHPRTRKQIRKFGLEEHLNVRCKNVKLLEPLSYLDMIMLEQNARVILTDSGGVQKEAYFFQVPCITLRAETEWEETVEAGWNRLVDVDEGRFLRAIHSNDWPETAPPLFGNGNTAEEISCLLKNHEPQ